MDGGTTIDDKIIIAKRVALELRDGNLVNLGAGIPTLVARYLPSGVDVYFQSENGIIGMSAVPDIGMEDDYLTDAGGGFIGALPGACSLDSCLSFSLIRGGHLDVTVLGGLQVDEKGILANWMVPGMGGGMDLVSGAKRVIIAMTHTAKGTPKIIKSCTLPITSVRRIDLIVTEMAVIETSTDGLILRETAPGVTVEKVLAVPEAKLIIPANVPEMAIS